MVCTPVAIVQSAGSGKLLGAAALKTRKLALGRDKITVDYSGNADFQGSTSATLKELIKKKPRARKPRKNGAKLPFLPITNDGLVAIQAW